MFADGDDDHWAAYIVGVFVVLARERGMPLTSGARMVIASTGARGQRGEFVGRGRNRDHAGGGDAFGLRSSPAISRCCARRAENRVAGAPCGVMDQMTCVFGDEHALLALLCQPAELQASVPIPTTSNCGGSIRASVTPWAAPIMAPSAQARSWACGSSPSTCRCQRVISRMCHPRISSRRWSAICHEKCRATNSSTRYGRTDDAVTTVERGRRYRVRAPTAHPVYERRRAETFRRLLLDSGVDSRRQLGELMYESHASYGHCGLGSKGTDRLVALVRAQGPAAGLYGARITGGGSGGTVAVVGRRGSSHAIARIVDANEQATGYRPYIFAGSSPGVMAFGARSITL